MAIEVDDGPVVAMAPPPAVGEFDFDAFFRLEYPQLLVLAAALTGHRSVAEELAQEAMWRACTRWGRISQYQRPGAWVRRVAINLALSHRARRRSEERSLDRLGRQRPPSPLAATDGEFWTVVRRLPKRQAAAVTLYYLEDRSVADVATILGCSENTAKVHLHRGRVALAHLLEHREHA